VSAYVGSSKNLKDLKGLGVDGYSSSLRRALLANGESSAAPPVPGALR
jgi:hypothetical protein